MLYQSDRLHFISDFQKHMNSYSCIDYKKERRRCQVGHPQPAFRVFLYVYFVSTVISLLAAILSSFVWNEKIFSKMNFSYCTHGTNMINLHP